MFPPEIETRFVVEGKMEHYAKNRCKINLKEPLKTLLRLQKGNYAYRLELILDKKLLKERVDQLISLKTTPLLLFITPA